MPNAGGPNEGAPAAADNAAGPPVVELPNGKMPLSARHITPDVVEVDRQLATRLWVQFTGGDPNCSAGRVEIIEQGPDRIVGELWLGLSDDAAARLCMAGEFAMCIAVDLDEPVAGRQVIFEAAPSPEPDRQLVTPDLATSDFVGLTEAEAAAIADPQMIPWRLVRVDDEHYMVTLDYNPGRLNFEIDGGRISAVTLG